MPSTIAFLDFAGFIAMLLWGTHMVQTGVQRAFGAQLRRFLGTALRNRFSAFAAGIGVTALLQSSTATALMATAFAAGGLINLVQALAVMLGANVGTTLIVQVLSFDVTMVAPIFILAGFVMFRRRAQPRVHDLGRAFIGLGLMLLALYHLHVLLGPVADSSDLDALLGVAAAAPILAVLLAAALTWAAHSSIVVVLLAMSMAGNGVISTELAFMFVLGANLGTAINPVLEGAGRDNPAARRLPLGNLINRVIGVVLVFAVAAPLGGWLVSIEPDSARAVANFHTLFNIAVALLFLPLLKPYAAFLRMLLPRRVKAGDPSRPLYLDPAARELPEIAVGNAAREALRLADTLDEMLDKAGRALVRPDRALIAMTKRRDDVLDALTRGIRTYLAALDIDELGEAERRRVEQILTFAMNMEHAGDVVDRNLLPHAARRLKQDIALSKADEAELAALIQRLRANLGKASSLFMTENSNVARLLADEKAVFREMAAEAARNHFRRARTARSGVAEDGLHPDLLRDIKLVNAHIVAAAAYPVLERTGELLPSRIATSPP